MSGPITIYIDRCHPEAGGGAWSVLETGDFSTPVESKVLDLPSPYTRFQLILNGVELTAPSGPTIWAAFSADGGSTYITDNTNFDAYKYGIWYDASPSNASAEDSLFPLANIANFTTVSKFGVEATIWPGAVGQNATVMSRALFMNTTGNTVKSEMISTILNEATGVINAMILLPTYGAGDGTPTTDEEFTAGSYTLLGMQQ